LIGGWQESTTNRALRDVVEATVGQRRLAGHRSQRHVEGLYCRQRANARNYGEF
jgi:hypothetical protein